MLRLALWGSFSHLAKRDKLPSGLALLASKYEGSGSGSGIATEGGEPRSRRVRHLLPCAAESGCGHVRCASPCSGAPSLYLSVPLRLPDEALGACDPLLNLFADQTLRSLRECEFVRKAAFEKYPDTGIAKRIGGCDQSDVTPGL